MKRSLRIGAALILCGAGVANAQTVAAVEEVAAPFRPPQPAKRADLPVKPYAAPAPSPAQATVQDAGATSLKWEVRTSDLTLSRTIQRWAETAGYRVRWDIGRNFQISAPTVFVGSFESALAALLSTPGLKQGDYPLEACIYANTPPLVRITRQGDQSQACDGPAVVAQP